MIHKTTDNEYSELLARLSSIPLTTKVIKKNTYTQKQESKNLFEDLMEINGEATW